MIGYTLPKSDKMRKVEWMKKAYKVTLSEDERSQLKRMTTVGRESVRQLKHGQILLQADAGQSDSEIAERVGVSVPTVGRIRKRYVTEGLAVALSDKQRSGRPPGLSAKTKATITALACSTPPEGRSRWTLRLLADKVVELDEEATLSHQSVHTLLKKTNVSLT